MDGVRERVFEDCECPWKSLKALRKVYIYHMYIYIYLSIYLSFFNFIILILFI